jgi:hypothetical protein
VDEIPTREEVMAGTFYLNKHPIIILFDYGASYDFLSSTCAKKAKLSLMTSGAPYMISTPGGRVDANQIVHKVSLELSERIFSTNLIILSGQGIDDILRMSWMKMHKIVLDIVGRLVHLNSPVYGKVILHLPTISRINTSLHHVVELKLDDIHVIREFLAVFPDDLPGMAPVKDWRRRSEGGEWEPIKIPLENLAYIPKSTRSSSLLTRSRPLSYKQAISLRNRARDHSRNTEWC